MLLAGVTFLAGAALGGAAVNVYMLILARVLLGIGVGFANQSVPLYVSEISLPKYRGAITSGFNLCTSIGVFSASMLNYGTQKIRAGYGWRISLAMAALPASLLTLSAFILPETPNSLIQRGTDHQTVLTALQKIRGTTNVQEELEDLIQASAISKTVKHPFRNMVQRRYRPQLVMAIAIPFFQQVTGINVITFYAPLLFRTIGQGESTSLMSAVVTGMVGTGATILSMLLVDRLGRRVLFVIGGIVMFISELMVGGILAAQLGDHGGLSRGSAYLVLVSVSIYLAGFGCSWGPLGWLVPAEIFPLEIRSAGQSITVAVGFVFIFAGAQSFLTMLCHLKSGTFFFFAGWLAVMTVFVSLLLPETKNIPIEQMERVWMNHWFWKRFVVTEEDKNGEVEMD
ncbi:hexose carrier protein HEX6-like [Aristolochia californica]|uniref:hexose carrier protein HEX6-like n=1 Tax=Aristolochia californica TaxID=171875 RepID=UPI0035D89180